MIVMMIIMKIAVAVGVVVIADDCGGTGSGGVSGIICCSDSGSDQKNYY